MNTREITSIEKEHLNTIRCKWDYSHDVCKIDIEQMGKLASFEAFKNIITDELHPLQCVDVLRALAYKKSSIIYETGMGKTYVASAWMKGLKNRNPLARFVMVIKNSQLIQTPFKIRRLTGFKILSVSGTSQSLNKLLKCNLLEYDLVLVTKEALRNPNIMKIISAYAAGAEGIVLDEAHEFTNIYKAKFSSMTYSLMEMFEYRMLLTATPLTTNLVQPAMILNMMNRNENPSVASLVSKLKISANYFTDGFGVIQRTRMDFDCVNNYEPVVVRVEPTEEQLQCRSELESDMINKGPGAHNTSEKVIEFVKDRKDKKGIIYVREHIIKDFLKEELEKAGIRVGLLNGKVVGSEREKVLREFEEDVYDVVILSLTTSVDLDCDYVLFYTFTSDAIQLIGRSTRGLTPKTVEVGFVFVLGTMDIIKFLRQIYFRSLVIKDMFNNKYGNLIEEFANGKALDLESVKALKELKDLKQSMEISDDIEYSDILEELILTTNSDDEFDDDLIFT